MQIVLLAKTFKVFAVSTASKILINVHDTFHCWGSENLGENEVEWIGMSETMQAEEACQQAQHANLYYDRLQD